MPPADDAARLDPVERQVWETLHHLVLEARLAVAENKDLLYAARHRQIDDLITTWEQERTASPLDGLLDQITLAPGAVPAPPPFAVGP